jgi:hypothetical protein
LLQARRAIPLLANWSVALCIEPLSHNGVPIFPISTYDTDYVLVQEEFMVVAQQALGAAGHALISGD